MARVTLEDVAYGRSGDKGDASNIGLVARTQSLFEWMRAAITAEWVADALSGFVKGPVQRYEIPGLRALNFVLHDSLGGGGTASLLTDAQGKTHAQALLRCVVEVPDELLREL